MFILILTNHYHAETYCDAPLTNAEFSVDAQTESPASNALSGQLSQTDSTGTGIEWKADIESGPQFVSSIQIDSSKEDGTGYRLSEVEVYVDDSLCGQLPSDT